jgi:hypothetical protein
MTTESITQDYVKQSFEYRDGELYWKVKPSKKISIGKKAGNKREDGYCLTMVNGKRYLNHRLIFLMHHGCLPEFIDHIDGNPSNNKIENLRAAKSTENQHNRKLGKDNTSGVKGVDWHARSKKWMVRIRVNNKRKYFGSFDNLELAGLVAQEARNKYHREFANHG